jgi:hypothetical protein
LWRLGVIFNLIQRLWASLLWWKLGYTFELEAKACSVYWWVGDLGHVGCKAVSESLGHSIFLFDLGIAGYVVVALHGSSVVQLVRDVFFLAPYEIQECGIDCTPPSFEESLSCSSISLKVVEFILILLDTHHEDAVALWIEVACGS